MGRLGLAGDGVGAERQAPRLHRLLAAIRRARRVVSSQPDGAVIQRDLRRSFLVWGWRIPFLISIVMVGIGLWIRLGIMETPVLRRSWREAVERVPTIEVIKRQPKEIILTALLRMAEQSPGYIFNAFIFTYGTQVLGASRNLLLTGLITTTALGFMWAPIAGALSDRIGRKKMYIIGCIFVAVFTFVYFAHGGSSCAWTELSRVPCSPHPSMYHRCRRAHRTCRGSSTSTRGMRSQPLERRPQALSRRSPLGSRARHRIAGRDREGDPAAGRATILQEPVSSRRPTWHGARIAVEVDHPSKTADRSHRSLGYRLFDALHARGADIDDPRSSAPAHYHPHG